jgi:hypothetical protein
VSGSRFLKQIPAGPVRKVARRLKEPLKRRVNRRNGGSGKENKMKTYLLRRSAVLTVFAALAIGAGTACDPKADAVPVKPAASPAPSAAPVSSPADAPVADDKKAGTERFVGRWAGPEGTYLSISEKSTGTPAAGKDVPKAFTIVIKNLDKAETFDGTAKGDVIEFTRKGKTESVKAATGAETGMKGFEKETNCVVVTKGSEGFCKKQ